MHNLKVAVTKNEGQRKDDKKSHCYFCKKPQLERQLLRMKRRLIKIVVLNDPVSKTFTTDNMDNH